jgi:hypothetical protein
MASGGGAQECAMAGEGEDLVGGGFAGRAEAMGRDESRILYELREQMEMEEGDLEEIEKRLLRV